MNQNLLNKIGLNKTESLVYKDLISHGESTPPKIAERTGLSRENAYFVLKALTEKSLIEKNEKKRKQIYRPLDPKKLKDLLEQDKQDIKEREIALESIIPELTNLYALNNSTPSVTFFKGIGGIKEMYEDVYRGETPKEVLAFRSVYDDDFLGDYAKKDLRRLTEKGIKTRTLSSEKGALPKGLDKKSLLIEEKVIKDNNFNFPAEIGIYNNKVLIASFKKDRIGTIIEGKEIAETLRMIFNYLWEKE